MYVRTTYYKRPVTEEYFRRWTSHVINACLENNHARLFSVEIDLDFRLLVVNPGFGLLGRGAVNGVTGEKVRLERFLVFRRRWMKHRDAVMRRIVRRMRGCLEGQGIPR